MAWAWIFIVAYFFFLEERWLELGFEEQAIGSFYAERCVFFFRKSVTILGVKCLGCVNVSHYFNGGTGLV